MVHVLTHMTFSPSPSYHLKVYINIIDCLYLGQQSSLFFLRFPAEIRIYYTFLLPFHVCHTPLPSHASCNLEEKFLHRFRTLKIYRLTYFERENFIPKLNNR